MNGRPGGVLHISFVGGCSWLSAALALEQMDPKRWVRRQSTKGKVSVPLSVVPKWQVAKASMHVTQKQKPLSSVGLVAS